MIANSSLLDIDRKTRHASTYSSLFSIRSKYLQSFHSRLPSTKEIRRLRRTRSQHLTSGQCIKYLNSLMGVVPNNRGQLERSAEGPCDGVKILNGRSRRDYVIRNRTLIFGYTNLQVIK
jgi:hypothetical protein